MRMKSRSTRPSAIETSGEAGGDAGGERIDGRAEHADAGAEQEHRGAGERVVPGAIITAMIKG